MAKKNGEQLILTTNQKTGNLEIQVKGDRLPLSVFNKILEIMRDNKNENDLPVVFLVYTRQMADQIRESLPAEFVKKIEWGNEAAALAPGEYRHAVGM